MQRTDPRCKTETVSPEDAEALEQLNELLKPSGSNAKQGLTSEDLAQKTRRGLEGRVRQGKSGGGLCFGYAVVRKLDAAGEVVRGERRINEAEAATVRRTFEEFAIGRSPRAIAQSLNKDGIPGPAAKSWGPSTIYGNWQRGTGILNNELYVGRLVWSQQFVKDPNTGRRQARPNQEPNGSLSWCRT